MNGPQRTACLAKGYINNQYQLTIPRQWASPMVICLVMLHVRQAKHRHTYPGSWNILYIRYIRLIFYIFEISARFLADILNLKGLLKGQGHFSQKGRSCTREWLLTSFRPHHASAFGLWVTFCLFCTCIPPIIMINFRHHFLTPLWRHNDPALIHGLVVPRTHLI